MAQMNRTTQNDAVTRLQLRTGGRLMREVTQPVSELSGTVSDFLDRHQATRGMSEYDVFTSTLGQDREVAVNGNQTMESMLRNATSDGCIEGKTFVIDVGVAHKGAIGRVTVRIFVRR